VVWWTLEILEVARATFSWAFLGQVRGTGNALRKPWETIGATRGQKGNDNNKQDLKRRTPPVICSNHQHQQKYCRSFTNSSISNNWETKLTNLHDRKLSCTNKQYSKAFKKVGKMKSNSQ